VGTIKLQKSIRDYSEYVGACLMEPMLAGQTYTFNLDIAAATNSNSYGGNTDGKTELLHALNFRYQAKITKVTNIPFLPLLRLMVVCRVAGIGSQ